MISSGQPQPPTDSATKGYGIVYPCAPARPPHHLLRSDRLHRYGVLYSAFSGGNWQRLLSVRRLPQHVHTVTRITRNVASHTSGFSTLGQQALHPAPRLSSSVLDEIYTPYTNSQHRGAAHLTNHRTRTKKAKRRSRKNDAAAHAVSFRTRSRNQAKKLNNK